MSLEIHPMLGRPSGKWDKFMIFISVLILKYAVWHLVKRLK